MIAQELVKAGASFTGKDGETRHVIIVYKPGSGYGVTWDSVPLSRDYYGNLSEKRKGRPHGYMPMRQFQKWAVAILVPAAQGAQGENNQPEPDSN